MARNKKGHQSVKHEIISRDNTRILIAVAVAVFLVTFCGFAVKTLFSQSLYHNRVIGEKKQTLTRLDTNIDALDSLSESYKSFVEAPENVLGGNTDGNGALDGDNAKIILDSLPGEYDYPALASSFEKILIDGGYEVGALGGTEDRSATNIPTSDAAPIGIPYAFSFISTLDGTKDLLETLEKSIRPMHMDRLGVRIGEGGRMQSSVTLHTYYTQQKAYELGSKVVE